MLQANAVPRRASRRRLVPIPARLTARARATWKAAARVARAASDKFPFTLLGTLLLGCGFLAVRELGQKRQDVVLYVAGLGTLAVVLVAALLVVGTALYVGIPIKPRVLPHARVEAGRVASTGFSLPSLGLLPLVRADWSWVEPQAVRVEARLVRGRLHEEVMFGERGEHDRTVRRLVIEDVLGIARVAFHFTEATPRTVSPALGRPLAAPLLEAFAGGDNVSHPAGPPDGDLIDMRRYVLGDPMKRVLWKVYARSRTLMVRLPERAISPTHRTLAFLASGEGDEAAAGVARMAVETGALGPEWRFAADQPAEVGTEDSSDPVRALAQIVRSRAARPLGGAGFGPFLERNEAWGGRCVLFASGRAGRWTDVALAQIARRPGRIEVVLGVDGIVGAERSWRWKRLFLLDEHDGEALESRVDSRALDDLVRRLTVAGASVTVVDRPTGKVHGRSGRRRRAA